MEEDDPRAALVYAAAVRSLDQQRLRLRLRLGFLLRLPVFVHCSPPTLSGNVSLGVQHRPGSQLQ